MKKVLLTIFTILCAVAPIVSIAMFGNVLSIIHTGGEESLALLAILPTLVMALAISLALSIISLILAVKTKNKALKIYGVLTIIIYLIIFIALFILSKVGG